MINIKSILHRQHKQEIFKPLEDGWLDFDNNELTIIKHKLGDPELMPVLKKLMREVMAFYAIEATKSITGSTEKDARLLWKEADRATNYEDVLSLPDKADKLLKVREARLLKETRKTV